MTNNFKTSIIKRNQEQKNLKIKITHKDYEHIIEIESNYLGHKLYLNKYKIGEVKWGNAIREFVQGATLGFIKNSVKFNFEIVENNKKYKAKLKFKRDTSGDYYDIHLIIDNHKMLYKEVSNFIEKE